MQGEKRRGKENLSELDSQNWGRTESENKGRVILIEETLRD